MKINSLNKNLIVEQLGESVKEQDSSYKIPAGYITINLSTKGKLGAPATIHVRNLKVRDVISLSTTDNTNLPSRLITVLNDIIYEDVDVANWHEKEVEELMVYIYANFYSRKLNDLPYTVTAEDKEFLRNQGETGVEIVKDIEDGKFKPTFSVDLINDLDTYDLDDNFISDIKITNKNTGFHVTFSYVKYGDRLAIKRWLDKKYANEEKRFAKIKSQIEFNNELILQKGNLDNLIVLDTAESESYKEYINRYLQDSAEIARIISIVDYNGQDVSKMSLEEKYNLIGDDPQIDYGMISKLTKRQNKNLFGIKPEVRIINPITHQTELRRFSFRIPTLVQALQVPGFDRYDDGYDDES